MCVMKKRSADHWRRLWSENPEMMRKMARIGCSYCREVHTIYNMCNRGVDPPRKRELSFDTDYLNCSTPENTRYRDHIKWMLLWVINYGDAVVNVGCPWIGLPMELFAFIYGFIERDEITFYLYHLKNNKLGMHNLMRKRVFKLPRLVSIYCFRNELSERATTLAMIDTLMRVSGKRIMYSPHGLDIYTIKDGVQSKERMPISSKDRESLFRYVGEKHAVRILIVPADDYALCKRGEEVVIRMFKYSRKMSDWTVDLIAAGSFLILSIAI